MKELTQIKDPVYVKPEKYTAPEKFILKYMKDERDLPFVHLCFQISITIIPLAILLYMPFVNGWWFAAIAIVYHYFNNVVFKGPFGLMMHCTSHRVLYKKEYNWMNYYITWVLAPFFGQAPETYFTHHMGMHHPENNMPDDDSSTLAFQRDSKKGFLKYVGRFLMLGIYDLCLYFTVKKRKNFIIKTIRGEVFFILFCILLSLVNWQATVVVFILPLFIFRVVAMMGNWAQHAFIDPNDPDNGYKNSITCINTSYNNKCWNDGYHISHHVRPALHYTEHPTYFLKTIDEYKKNQSIIFDGIHFLHIFIWLMQKNYKKLAAAYVNLDNRYNNDEEVIEFLRQRTSRIDISQYESKVFYPLKEHRTKREHFLQA